MLRTMRSGSVIVVLVAAGAGERLGAEEPKAFLPIGDRPILGVAATAAAAPPDGAVPVLPLTDTVLRVEGRAVAGVEVREELALAQTPQAFRTAAVREAHDKAQVAGVEFTDDASVLAWAGFEVRTVPGDPGNMKITTLADLAEADRRMRGQ